MNKSLIKTKKANIVFLKDVEYVKNSKMYKSAEFILKEEYCNIEYYLKFKKIKKVSFDKEINIDFDRTKYFRVNTDILPCGDPMYLRYFNCRNIDVDEIETDDEIIITYNVDDPQEILICFQTKAEYGVYKTVMKYNLFRLIKELDCDLWASLDVTKPFKLVEKNRVIPLNSMHKNMNVIGEIKQEQVWWAIYHPIQIKETLYKIQKQKDKINKIEEPFEKKRFLNQFKNDCFNLKKHFFVGKDDEYCFTSKYAKFW